jgi:hypothetical protein
MPPPTPVVEGRFAWRWITLPGDGLCIGLGVLVVLAGSAPGTVWGVCWFPCDLPGIPGRSQQFQGQPPGKAGVAAPPGAPNPVIRLARWLVAGHPG